MLPKVNVLSLINEPSKVGSRHVQVDPAMWDVIMQHVGDDAMQVVGV